MTSHQIKAVVASHFRYIRQCPVVAFEVEQSYWARADIMIVTKARHLLEIEVKTTMADLKRDAKKQKHRGFRDRMTAVRHFYFAVPAGIADEAKQICDSAFPYAGVLNVQGGIVSVCRNPKPLTDKRLPYRDVIHLIRGQSATVCRLASKVEELLGVQQNLMEQLKNYREAIHEW